MCLSYHAHSTIMRLVVTTLVLWFLGSDLAKAHKGHEDDYDKVPCIKNYNCFWPICFPENYTTGAAPTKQTRVYVNILSNSNSSFTNNEIHDIDILKKTFKYSAKLLMAWQDQRLKFCDHNSSQVLDNHLQNHLWAPDIRVGNLANPEAELFGM